MTMDNHKAPMSLEDLPTEILSIIVSHLCHHCRLGPLRSLPNFDPQDDVQALQALTHVSTRFRSVALPIVFHNPTSHFEYYDILPLLEREPELARHVKVLFLPTSSVADAKNLPLLVRMIERVAVNIGSIADSRNLHKDVETGLLMSLCPNLEHVGILLSDDKGWRQKTTFGFVRRHWEQLGGSPGFPNLRFLEINTSRRNRFSFDSPQVSMFLPQAPSLETLLFRDVEGHTLPGVDEKLDLEACRPALQSLTTLQVTGWSFWRRGDREFNTLGKMIALATNLRNFKYSTDSNSKRSDRRIHMPPMIFIEILMPLAGNLHHLTLDFGREVHTSGDESPSLIMISPEQMSRFASLQSLELNVSCFCKHPRGRHRMGVSFDRNTCLTELLPLTVRDLAIRGFSISALGMVPVDRRWRAPWEDVLHLGRRALAGDFLRLKRVDVCFPSYGRSPLSYGWDDYTENQLPDEVSRTLDKRREEFKAAFEGSGVETGFRDYLG